MAERVHVVIAGGGFGGIYAGLQCERIIADPDRMRLTLISRDNFFVFTPMLHEVSSGSIATRHITIPIRKLYRKCDFREAEIESIDLASRHVVTVHGARGREHRHSIEYTHLLIALGSVTNFYGMENVERHAMTMKTIGDAIILRNHIIDMLEQAEVEPTSEQDGLLTFVVAGAGFAGVELVAEMNDFVREAARNYRHVDRCRIRVLLVHPETRVLPELSEDLGEFALGKLRKRGIEILLGTRINDASPDEVTLSDGSKIPTRSLIWTAGVAPDPILATLPCDHDQRGRILTNQFLEVPDYENVWAIGDCAAVPDLRSRKTYPPTAQHAIRQGRLAASNIAASIMGGQKRAFVYDMKGQLASLGERSGVANLYGIKFSGFLAWWLWRTIYLFKLPQLDRKVRVALDWTLDLVFARDIVKLKTLSPELHRARAIRSGAQPAMNRSKSKDQHERTSRSAASEGTTAERDESRRVVNVPDDHSLPQSRRSFLGLMTSLMGTTVAAIMSAVFAGYSLFPVFKKVVAEDWTDVGPIDEIPDGEATKRAVVISQDGGWGRFNSQQLVWIEKKGDNLVVYSAACPHLGCTINAAESGFICPCHGSAWNRDGSKVGGPAPRGMDTLEYRVEEGILQVKYRFFRQGVADKQVIA
ncbi:MAG TPA: FAD-dependent oxidoreductase [Blastocatellia bacterium]|nr:FAD-dependent oxidoreductase [Blastocatellia bacterium]